MKCFDYGTMQAFIDNELDLAQKNLIEDHLKTCEKCCVLLNRLNFNNDFTKSKITQYHEFNEKLPIKAKNAEYLNLILKNNNKKGFNKVMLNYKKFAIAASICIAFSFAISVQPVRAAISNALSVFRADNVKAIKFSVEDLSKIQNQLASHAKDINIENFGSIKTEHGKTIENPNLSTIKNIKILTPEKFSTITPKISLFEPSKITFNLNISNVNELMKTLGSTKLLPKNIDGKTFSINTANAISYEYNYNDKFISILETTSPEIIVPEGVNEDEIYEAIVSMPIFPDNIKSQLVSTKDWKNTLMVPIMSESYEEINIDGIKGFYSNASPGNDKYYSSLVWIANDTIYTIQGTDKTELLDIAKSMR